MQTSVCVALSVPRLDDGSALVSWKGWDVATSVPVNQVLTNILSEE